MTLLSMGDVSQQQHHHHHHHHYIQRAINCRTMIGTAKYRLDQFSAIKNEEVRQVRYYNTRCCSSYWVVIWHL